MTLWRRVAVALLLALPIEAANVLLCGIMLDPGPFPAGIFPELLGYEWLFFHYVGFRLLLERFHYRVLGIEAGLVWAFVLAYLQTALFVFLIMLIANRLRERTSVSWRGSEAHSSRQVGFLER